jgi:hypothetical protein
VRAWIQLQKQARNKHTHDSAACVVLHRAWEARPYLYQIVQCQIDRSHRERQGWIGMVAPHLACWCCCFSAGGRGGHACMCTPIIPYAVQRSTRGLCWHGMRLRPASAWRVCPEISQCRSWPRRSMYLCTGVRSLLYTRTPWPGPGYYYCSMCYPISSRSGRTAPRTRTPSCSNFIFLVSSIPLCP